MILGGLSVLAVIVGCMRGREKCRSPEEIVAEVRWLCSQGYSEVTLLGQTVGKDRHGDTSFAGLLHQLDRFPACGACASPPLYPTDFTDELIDTMAELPTVCEQVHMPVQSGSSRVLKKMRRRYTREEDPRRVLEDPPGDAFRQPEHGHHRGLSGRDRGGVPGDALLLEVVRFDHVFAFALQRAARHGSGAPAGRCSGVRQEAAPQRVVRGSVSISRQLNEALLGTLQEVLVEGPSGREEGQLMGRTRGHKIVNFPGAAFQAGELVLARISFASAHSLQGEIVEIIAPAPAAGCSTSASPDLVQII